MWLKDSNGAIYRIASIVAVTPLEQRSDKRDQSKVTGVHAAIGAAGGQIYHTSIDFNEAVEAVNPTEKTPKVPAGDPEA